MKTRKLVTKGLLGLTVAAASFMNAHAANGHESESDVRLILQVTVDGLRADLLTSNTAHFGQGGFRYLLENGTVFANANYQHANTETIVGHATLATGAHPSVHGMTGNVWYDAEAKQLAYNIEDPDSLILPVREEESSGDQVDPAQNLARTSGRSPKALLAETFADNLVRFYYRPYVYLDNEAIEAAGLNPSRVREVLAEALTREPGIHLAATRRMMEGWPDQKLLGLIRNNYHSARAGDIYIVQEPYWFNFDKGPVVAMHGSPWNYDTHVPLIFAGPGIESQKIHRLVQPADLAPTLSLLLGMTPPASSQSLVLPEVMGQ